MNEIIVEELEIPVPLGDPFILLHNGTYYAYGCLLYTSSLRNRGFELSLGWKDQVSDFKYVALLNITTLSNKVLSLGYEKPFIDSGQARTRLTGPRCV